MRWIVVVAIAGAVASTTACETEQQEEPTPTQQEQVAEAEARYSPAMFDTVSWASDNAAIARGSDIYKWACAECHGTEGRGDGGRVIDGDTIRPPSFHQTDWPYAQDPELLHEKIFVGNTLGMPHWGLRQMRPRDVVAVERYIRTELIREDGQQQPGAADGAADQQTG